MRKGEIWNLINRIIWSQEKENYEVVFIDRLQPNFSRSVRGDKIIRVLKSGLIEISDGSLIPLHRVLEIRYRNSIIFSRRKRFPVPLK